MPAQGTVLIATTSNGVYRLGPGDDAPVRILSRPRGVLWSPRRYGAFFGITAEPVTGRVLVAARARRGWSLRAKYGTDVILYELRPPWRNCEPVATIRDVWDVHQIAVVGGAVLFTDTGRDRVVAVELERGRRTYINFGSRREDTHHVNALLHDGRHLLVGLNNRGRQPAQVMRLDALRALGSSSGEIAAEDCCEEVIDTGLKHTHDLVLHEGALYVCASHEGAVWRLQPHARLLRADDWARGLAVGGGMLWVGCSPVVGRRDRHREDLDGRVRAYRLEDLAPAGSWTLRGAGQVNDLLVVEM